MSELLKREKMAQTLFEVGAPPHQFWDEVGLDKRELYLCMADAVLSQGLSCPAPTVRQVPMAVLKGQIERLRKNDFAGMETMRTFALGIIDDLLPQSAASTVEPVAWQPLPYETPRQLWAAFKAGAKFRLNYHGTVYDVTNMEAREHVVYVQPPGLPVKIKPDGSSGEGTSQTIWLYTAPTTSPEPDAVREKHWGYQLDNLISLAGNNELLNYQEKDGPSSFLRRMTIDRLEKLRAEILAALSRPAHGGWQDISTAEKFTEHEERGIYTDNGDGLFFFKATHWRPLARNHRNHEAD